MGLGFNHEATVLEKANILCHHCLRCTLLPRLACGFLLLMWARDTGAQLPGGCIIVNNGLSGLKKHALSIGPKNLNEYLVMYGIQVGGLAETE